MAEYVIVSSDSDDREAVRESARAALARAQELAVRVLRGHADATANTLAADSLIVKAAEVRDELRETVAAHARFMRRLDVTPERVIMVVKEVATGAARDALAGHASDWATMRTLRDDLVRWTIDAYYAAM
jgi:hypothetical protein